MIFRLIYSVIYSALILTLTGIPQTASAVVSCQDTINPNTSIRYSDALVSFKEYNGKTYAVAKSAATGGTSAAESFFDFSANITRAYTMTGDSTGSLKNLLSLGQYGAATPVRIDSADTRQFILKQFGKYLGTATTSRSTYIDAWKEYGSGGFTALDGTDLSYANWASPVYTGQNPQAVVMGADGKWTSGLDGARSAQIIQFDGKLDCAVSITPPQPGSIPPPPPPSGSAGPDVTKPVCGQDLNGNGDAADQGEVANCTQTTQGLLCPVGAVNCVESYSEPVCPAGSTLNTARDMCQAAATVTCGPGYSYDPSIDKCMEQVSCPDGGTFNPVTDQCEKLVLNQCPTGYSYDSSGDICRMVVSCGPGAAFYALRDRCEKPPAWDCPAGFNYNAVTAKCEAAPYCPAGTTYNATRDRCETGVGSCPSGYTYNAVLDKCVTSAVCAGGGVLNGASDKCEVNVSISCPSGWNYSAARGLCEQAPSCGAPGSYDVTNNFCLTPSTGTTCPSGYSYNAAYGTCIANPVCVGGTYSAVNNRCEATPNYTCSDPSYTYNSGKGRCEKMPVCSQGTYNSVYNMCLLDFTKGCPAGYSYNPVGDRCEKTPECAAGTFNTITNKCETLASYPAASSGSCSCEGDWDNVPYAGPGQYPANLPSCAGADCEQCLLDSQARYGSLIVWFPASPSCSTSYSCPSGGTLQGTQCVTTSQINPTCTSGTFDYSTHLCYASYTAICPSGMLYDAPSNKCASAAACTNGLLDTASDRCYQAAVTGCPSGYSLSGSSCVVPAQCSSGGALNGSIDYCTYAASYACPNGYSYSATYGQCYQTANCGSGSLNGSLDVCQQSYALTCPSGYVLNGTTCQTAPSCTAGGSYNASLDLCDGGSNVCSSPLALDPAVDKCYQAAVCSGGTLNAATDKCEASATANCGSWIWDGTAQVCYSPPVCSQGAYDATANECRATVTRNCDTYGWSSAQGKCTRQIVCPIDGGYALSNTAAYSSTLDECVSDAQHACPAGTTYNGLPIEKCEAVPICTGDGIYNPTVHGCFLGLNTCPLGAQYPCMDNQGTMQCSPNQCFIAGAAGTEQNTTMDESMLQNDGQRDQDGNCLDQLYIFNGKASRCRPSGYTVGYTNNCCKSDKVGSDDMGSNISTVSNGIQTAYELGQVAYYGNALAAGTAEITSVSTTASGAISSMTVVTASGSTATLSGASATGAYGAMASGATGAEAVTAGITEYVGALLNPTTIVVAVVVMVVMRLLYGSGCDQADIQTGMQAAATDCHYVGDYCEKKWVAVGCVQKAKSYCCFNTKMARIIHEQGRPQLVSFGADGGWGTPGAPECRGFTPDEFQSLDFSRIDLSEYFEDIQKDLGTKIQGAQTSIQNKVKQHFQATSGGK